MSIALQLPSQRIYPSHFQHTPLFNTPGHCPRCDAKLLDDEDGKSCFSCGYIKYPPVLKPTHSQLLGCEVSQCNNEVRGIHPPGSVQNIRPYGRRKPLING